MAAKDFGPIESDYAFFMEHRPEFLAHYHRRSNVESTFWMVKSKFGAVVRSKLPAARENEVLAKCVCHNLCVLTQTFYESGIAPRFWGDLGQTAVSASEVGGVGAGDGGTFIAKIGERILGAACLEQGSGDRR